MAERDNSVKEFPRIDVVMRDATQTRRSYPVFRLSVNMDIFALFEIDSLLDLIQMDSRACKLARLEENLGDREIVAKMDKGKKVLKFFIGKQGIGLNLPDEAEFRGEVPLALVFVAMKDFETMAAEFL